MSLQSSHFSSVIILSFSVNQQCPNTKPEVLQQLAALAATISGGAQVRREAQRLEEGGSRRPGRHSNEFHIRQRVLMVEHA